MATHSSVLAWRIPGTGEPGGLPSLGSHRVGHEGSDLAAAAAAVWNGLPLPSPGDLPNPGIEPRSSILQADALPSEPPGKPLFFLLAYKDKVKTKFYH